MGKRFQVSDTSAKKLVKFSYYIVQLLFLVFGIVFLSIIMLSTSFINDTQYVPTIVNGVTSSTSIMIAASGMLLTYFRPKKILSLVRVMFMILGMVFSSCFVFMTYFGLMTGFFVDALRFGMLGLLISLLNFLSAAVEIIEKL